MEYFDAGTRDYWSPLANPHKYTLVYRPHMITLSGKPRDLKGIGRGGVEYGNHRIFAIITSWGKVDSRHIQGEIT